MLLHAIPLFLLLRLVGVGASCGCSYIVIPVHVDVFVPKDPFDIFAGLKSDAADLRPIKETYDIYGVFCRPDTAPAKNADVLQILIHGFSYSSQYWSPTIEEFRNYSYTAFACDRGMASLAIDSLGVGLSSRPADPADVQYPTSAGTISQLARHLKKTSIVPGVQPFNKIIGIGHSLGSALLNFAAIVDGAESPFDALIMTGQLMLGPDDPAPGSGLSLDIAREINPARWGALDPGYVTLGDRVPFYPADVTAYSQRMLEFDAFTKDVGTGSMGVQAASSSVPAENYTGAVAKLMGSEDQVFCSGGRCDTRTEVERAVWPAAKSFEFVVSQGSGHDLNLDFLAAGVFDTIFGFVDQFSG
ncbi:Alpha/Beta hydrolase protein [Mycena crocata]|nr:Alpha/Beta hydrolase protein [Mycena crocata]